MCKVSPDNTKFNVKIHFFVNSPFKEITVRFHGYLSAYFYLKMNHISIYSLILFLNGNLEIIENNDFPTAPGSNDNKLNYF